jgi:preprotein translocase subunit SecY
LIPALQNAVKVGDLRKKILFTLFMFLVFRIGAHIPIPGIDPAKAAQVFQSSFFNFFDTVSGGAFKRMSIFAMSITPYINSSIIMQLLTVVIPRLEQLQKEGDEGRKKITQYTRYGTVILGFVQAIGLAFYVRPALTSNTMSDVFLVAITMTAGTIFLMWLGEQITEKGIGNGISLIIFAGIVSRIPTVTQELFRIASKDVASLLSVVVLLILLVLAIVATISVQEGQRRVPVQYAKRVVGRKVYGGQSTHIPLKLNHAGVIPVIFASVILTLPVYLTNILPGASFSTFVNKWLGFTSPVYMVLFAALTIFFTYFYTAVSFNPVDVADNMKKYGGFIPGLRPGRPTAEYLDRVLTRLTFSGALFLAAIAIMPNIILGLFGQAYSNANFGGTALLIVVGVALETMKQIESHLITRHYQGFMK